MCIVSDKLKLCTCNIEELDKLKHTWVLYRIVKGKKHRVIGSIEPPYNIDSIADLKNAILLLQLLNEQSVFDSPVEPKPRDLLQLTFTVGENNETVDYGFVYKGGRWREKKFDSFEWMYEHEEHMGGKIKNALKRSKATLKSNKI